MAGSTILLTPIGEGLVSQLVQSARVAVWLHLYGPSRVAFKFLSVIRRYASGEKNTNSLP